MDNQENDTDQNAVIDPVEVYLSFLSGSGVVMEKIGRTIGHGMLEMVDGCLDLAKEFAKAFSATYEFRFNFLSDEQLKKLRREKRRARYQRMMTGKHGQRARSSRG